MKAHFRLLELSTTKRVELLDITKMVEEVVGDSNIMNGLCLVFAPHATAAIIVNEDEEGLRSDVVKWIEEVFPHNGGWKHNMIDDNASAHLASAFSSSSRIFPVKDGRVFRGTWQSIFFLEMDGPRRRRIMVEVLGE
ncbi:MAG: secondary thiamine-phosphate synthase enzyme YjbQ [Candidatus Nezhaarchaeota archaeon]|nr:secondary thiamine-phosphate synthase enzyme YjbQ [Candidatus Nezhaarchaeota archaeon]